MKMPEHFRVLDYLIFFILIAGLGILNIRSPGPWLAPLLGSLIAGLGGSLVLGTFTNVVFRRSR